MSCLTTAGWLFRMTDSFGGRAVRRRGRSGVRVMINTVLVRMTFGWGWSGLVRRMMLSVWRCLTLVRLLLLRRQLSPFRTEMFHDFLRWHLFEFSLSSSPLFSTEHEIAAQLLRARRLGRLADTVAFFTLLMRLSGFLRSRSFAHSVHLPHASRKVSIDGRTRKRPKEMFDSNNKQKIKGFALIDQLSLHVTTTWRQEDERKITWSSVRVELDWFLSQKMPCYSRSTSFPSCSHMSHLTPRVGRVPVNSVRCPPLVCLRLSSICNLQEQITSALESICNSFAWRVRVSLISSILISKSDDTTFFSILRRMCYLHKWSTERRRLTERTNNRPIVHDDRSE